MKTESGLGFIMVMVIIAVSALLLRIAIDKVIKVVIAQNESTAQSTLKLFAAALEKYAKDNKDIFPTSLKVLTQAKPPYIDRDYVTQSPIKGYDYICSSMTETGYSCSAIPDKCKLTGKMVYTINTGGLFISEDCRKRD